MHSIELFPCAWIVSFKHSLVLLAIAFLLTIRSVSAQQLEPVMVDRLPALKYTDKNGCVSPINFGRIAGQEEAIAIRVVHFHGSSWGDKGWLGITRSRIFFRPDPGQKDEHAFSIPRSEYKEAKASKDGKVHYLTLVSTLKKNQEFAIGCIGNTHDIDDMFTPILNYSVLACNDFDAGIREFKQLTAKVQPPQSEQDLTIADLVGLNPKTSAAESRGSPAKDEATGDAKTFCNLGKSYLKVQLYGEAVRAFKRAVGTKADYAEAYNGLGDAYLYSGQPKEALSAYSQAIKINPRFAEAYNGLGIAYSDVFQPEEALKALKQAAKLQPDSPSSFYFMGLTYKRLGKRKEAIEALQETVRLNPKFAEAFEILGDIYSDTKEYAAAIDAYRSLVQLQPDSSVAHSRLANSYSSSGRKQEALDEHELTIKLSPKDPSSYHNIGNTYASMGRFDEAIRNYKLAIGLKSDYVPSHFMLGRAFFKNGDKASAIEQYNFLKTLDPNAAKLLLDEINH